jgi:hypothetical protein
MAAVNIDRGMMRANPGPCFSIPRPLLLSVARSDADPLVTALNNAGVPAVEIGEVLPQGKPLIRVV